MFAMILVTVPMDVYTDTGDLLVNRNALQIVTSRPVIVKLDTVSAVSLVIWEIHVIHSAQCTVSKECVTKTMGTVLRDAHQDCTETRVITHVVMGV